MNTVEQLEASGEVLSPAVREVTARLEAVIAQQAAEIVALQERIRELEARLKQDSTNSSKPPSSDAPGVVREKKKPTGGKRGGQSGHRGHFRQQIPPERVDVIVEHRPQACESCGHTLAEATQTRPEQVHQVTELPAPRAEVTEHRMQCLRCPKCGEETRAELPREVGGKHFGPRLVALGAELHGKYRLSLREVVDLLGRMLDVPGPSLGSAEAFTREASAALKPVYAQVQEAVRKSEAAGVDETPWKESGAKRWLWTAVTRAGTLFHLGASRGSKELRLFLGDFGGIVNSDRWCAYQIYARRQLCWAHIERSFRKLGLRGGEAEVFAKEGEAICGQLFELWGKMREEGLTREELRSSMKPVQERLRRLIEEGLRSSNKRVAGFSRNITKLRESLWTFLEEPVEPTNNAAERAIRPAVLWRKISFGSQSEAGLRWVERVLTLNATCRQLGIDPIDALRRSVEALRSGTAAPKLLPSH